MKEEGKHYVDATKVSVAPIAKSIAKDMIIKSTILTLGLLVDTHWVSITQWMKRIYSEMTKN